MELGLEIFKESLGESHPHIAVAHNHLAEHELRYGDLEKAQAHATHALTIYASHLDQQHPDVVGDDANRCGDRTEAWQSRESSRRAENGRVTGPAILRGTESRIWQAPGTRRSDTGRCRRAWARGGGTAPGGTAAGGVPRAMSTLSTPVAISSLGAAMLNSPSEDRAGELIRTGGRLLAEQFGEDHPEVARAAIPVAQMIANRDPNAATEVLAAVTTDLTNQLGPRDREVVEASFELARLYVASDRPEAAAQILEQSLNIAKEHYGSQSPELMRLSRLLGEVHQCAGPAR